MSFSKKGGALPEISAVVSLEKFFAQGLKPKLSKRRSMYGQKPVPFETEPVSRFQVSSMSRFSSNLRISGYAKLPRHPETCSPN